MIAIATRTTAAIRSMGSEFMAAVRLEQRVRSKAGLTRQHSTDLADFDEQRRLASRKELVVGRLSGGLPCL